MIGDVLKAENKFRKMVGDKSKANDLLKKPDSLEALNLGTNGIPICFESKFEWAKNVLNSRDIEDLLGPRGIVYLLSTKPHTNSNSNFVKLVETYVVNNKPLEQYLVNPQTLGQVELKNVQAVRNRLIRYLKLTNSKDGDEPSAEETDERLKAPLTRKKNADVTEKMQSRRKVNRLKVIVTSLLIYLINMAKEVASDRAERWEKGIFTQEEFRKLKNDEKLKNKLTRITIPHGVDVIGKKMFKGCKELEEVIVPGYVKTIGSEAFSECKKLRELVTEDGVEIIGKRAFMNCHLLKKITVAGSVEEILFGAFLGCPKDMEILGGASEAIKDRIREQIGAIPSRWERFKERAKLKSEPETHFYKDFVEKFNEMESKKDYERESIQTLYNIYAEHEKEFMRELKSINREERETVGKRLLKYHIRARGSVNDEEFLIATIQKLRNQIVDG